MEITDTQDAAAERVGVFLRAAFQRSQSTNVTGWRAKKAEKLEVSEDAFYGWFMGDTAPQLHHSVKLAAEFGAEFIDAVYGLAGLEAFPIGSETKRLELGRFIVSLINEHEDWAKRLRDGAASAGIKLPDVPHEIASAIENGGKREDAA